MQWRIVRMDAQGLRRVCGPTLGDDGECVGDANGIQRGRRSGVRAFGMKEIDAYGAARVVRGAMKDLSHVDRVHLSLDLDVVDPEVAPGVGTPVRGGLTYREAHLVMELINEAAVVTSLDVVEINPILDSRNGTAKLAVELVESLMGRQIIGLPW